MDVDVLLEVEELLRGGLDTLVAQKVLKGEPRISQSLQREGVAGQTEVDVVLRKRRGGRQ